MKVADQEIITPMDALNNPRYQLDWRSRVIAACASFQQVPIVLRKDQDLITAYTKGLFNTPEAAMFKAVGTWRGTEIGDAAEACLLTAASYGDIAQIMGVDAEAVRLYGSLYYSVRDGSGKVTPGVLMCVRLRLEDEQGDRLFLKRAALLGGFPLLLQVLAPVPVDAGDGSVARLAQRELLTRVLDGDCSASDLSKIVQSDLLRQQNNVGSEHDPNVVKLRKYEELFAAMFKRMQPELCRTELTAERRNELNAALQSKLQAEGNISQAQVFDAGPERGREMINKIFDRAVNVEPGQEFHVGQLR